MGDRDALERSIEFGEEYVTMVTCDEFSRQVAERRWAGDAHCLALAWLGRHGRAASMVLAMLEDDRMGLQPGDPGTFGIYVVPAVTLGLLLCVAREAAESGGGDAANDGGENDDNGRDGKFPTFASLGTEQGGTMTAEQVVCLRKKSDDSIMLASKLAGLYGWARTMVSFARALIAWGVGGSTSSAIKDLQAVVASAEEQKIVFFADLAHLYSA